MLRWFYETTQVTQLAHDHGIGLATAYRYLYEAIEVLAAATPGLHQVLQAARAAGRTHLSLDGTVVRIDRVRRPGPNPGVDLWWSGKHHHHGGDNQVLTAPDGRPIWATRASPPRSWVPRKNHRGRGLTDNERTRNLLRHDHDRST